MLFDRRDAGAREFPGPRYDCGRGRDPVRRGLVEEAFRNIESGRDPLGDARFDPALRVHQRVGAEPLDRRRGRQDGSRVTAGLDEPAHQVLVRLRLFPLRRGSRSTSSRATPPGKDRNPYKTAQFGQMLVPGLGPHRVVGELVPVQVELAAAAGPPPVAVGRRTCRPAAWACGCSPARACRSTPRPRPAASCSASSRRWPSSSGS